MAIQLKTMIGLVGLGGVAIFATLMTYEFVELIINIMYTAVLSIVVAFFYQNKENAKSIILFLFDIQLGDDNLDNKNIDKKNNNSNNSHLHNSGEQNHQRLQNHIGQHRIGAEFNTDQQQQHQHQQSHQQSQTALINDKRKSDKEIVAQLYDQIKELNLQFFTERVNSDKEKLALQQRIAKLESSGTDANQERAKWKIAAEQQKAKNTELIKERDHLLSLESKHQSKLSDYERKERGWKDNESKLLNKINDSTATITHLKRELDDRAKRVGKLEDQVAKLQKQIQNNSSHPKEMQVFNNTTATPSVSISNTSVSSSSSSSTTSSVVSSQSNHTTTLGATISSSTFGTTTVSSQSTNLISPSPSTSPNGVVHLPPPTIVTTTTAASVPSSSISLNSNMVSSDRSNSMFGLRDSSEDEDTSSNSSISSSPSSTDTPKLKNLFKKVKNGSSKIINKASNHLNNKFNTDFFTPPTSSPFKDKETRDIERDIFDSNPVGISTSNSSSKENILASSPSPSSSLSSTAPIVAAALKEKKVMFDANVEKELFGNGGADFYGKSTTSLDEPIFGSHDGVDSKKDDIPDIFTFDDEPDKLNEKDELSDLLNFDTHSTSLNFKFGGNQLINDTSSNSSSGSILDDLNGASNDSSASLFSCIKEFNIKESENKAGLRRAKKKPLTPDANMMEDVSFGAFPFNNNNEVALFGVFDGHAGREAAEMSLNLFPAEVKKIISSQPNYLDRADMSDLFVTAFNNVDNLLKEECQYVGCTATVSFIWTYSGQRYLQVANLGDSSSFLCRNGAAVEMTFDHKASHPLEKKRMIEAGIPVTEYQTRINGVAVSRSLGNHFIKDQNIGMIAVPHISKPILLQDTDTFLVMASDGLWDVISGEKAIEMGQDLIETRGAQSLASNLLQSALQMNDCKDNVTVIVVKL